MPTPNGSSRRRAILISAIVILCAVFACGIGVSVIRRGQLTQHATSPDGRWEVRIYRVAAPATDRDVIRATASLNGNREKEVLATSDLERVDFLDEQAGTLSIRWLGGDRVQVGGYSLDLAHDHVEDL